MNTLRVFNHYVHVKYLALCVAQLLMLLASVLIAVQLRFLGTGVPMDISFHQLWPRALIYAVVIVIGMYSIGTYDPRGRDGHLQVVLKVLIGFGVAVIALSILFYLLPGLYLGRGVMALSLAISLLCVIALQLFFHYVVDPHLRPWRVLFYGAGDNAAKLLAFLRRRSDKRLFRLVGCISAGDEAVRVDTGLLLRCGGSLSAYAQAHRIDEIVVAMDDQRQQFPADELMACRVAGINVIDTLTFYERQTGKIKTDLLRPSWIIFSYGFRFSPLQDAAKRALDLAVSTLMIVLSSPIMLGVGLAIFWEERRGPVFYTQTRVGIGGQEFRIIKFRSMRLDAEAAGAQWATTDDPRVTRVGRVIRKYRLDELPQLFNVLGGEMSLVGPRPERPEFVAELARELPYYRVRERVKPGITGWAQLGYPYGASVEDANGKLQLDLYYVKNRSFLLDLLILLATTEVVLFRRGGR